MMHFSIVLDTRWTTSVYVVYLFTTVASAALSATAFESDPWTSGVKSGAIAIPLTQYATGKNEKEKVLRGKMQAATAKPDRLPTPEPYIETGISDVGPSRPGSKSNSDSESVEKSEIGRIRVKDRRGEGSSKSRQSGRRGSAPSPPSRGPSPGFATMPPITWGSKPTGPPTLSSERRRCQQLDADDFIPQAMTCGNKRSDRVCEALFAMPNPRTGFRDGKCNIVGMEDVSESCRKQCGICCEDIDYACEDDKNGIIDCTKQLDKCHLPKWFDILSRFCAGSCGLCTKTACRDYDVRCREMKAHCLSSDHRDFMMEKCARTCGFCIVGETTSIAIAAGSGVRGVPVKTAPAIPACIDHHLNCTINEEWCANPLYAEYMIKFCAKTCFKCVTVPVTASGGGQPQPQIQIIMPQPSPPSGLNGPRGKVSSPQVPDDEDEEAETPGKPKPSEQLKRPQSATKRPTGGKKVSTQPPQMSPRPVSEEEEETSKRSSVPLRQSPATVRPTSTTSRRSTPSGTISTTRAVPTSEPLDPSVASLVPSEAVKIKEPCKDNHDKCVVWVTKGFCSSTTYSLDEIRKMCGKSCKLC